MSVFRQNSKPNRPNTADSQIKRGDLKRRRSIVTTRPKLRRAEDLWWKSWLVQAAECRAERLEAACPADRAAVRCSLTRIVYASEAKSDARMSRHIVGREKSAGLPEMLVSRLLDMQIYDSLVVALSRTPKEALSTSRKVLVRDAHIGHNSATKNL